MGDCQPGQVLNDDGKGEGLKAGSLVSVVYFSKIPPESRLLIDIRPRQEFEKDGVEGAINIFLHDIVNQANLIDKSRPVYVYCANGSKGSIAVMVLRDLGYEVYNIDGGLQALQDAGIV